MVYAPLLARVDHASLERVVCAGEVLNPQALQWLQDTVLEGRVPVIDHMWQTETGGPAFGNPYGLGLLPIKPGSACVALPGIDAAVVTPDGQPCGTAIPAVPPRRHAGSRRVWAPSSPAVQSIPPVSCPADGAHDEARRHSAARVSTAPIAANAAVRGSAAAGCSRVPGGRTRARGGDAT